MSSPASSGPAGPHFEGQVGAYYLLSLLAGAEARGLPGCTVHRIALQGAPEGHSLDDVIVDAHDTSGRPALLEIQVKRSITFAPSDDVFAAVMAQVASAVLTPGFFDSRRELAVATSQHSRQIDGPYQDVLTWARELGDAASFHKRLALPNVANPAMRDFVTTFRTHLRTYAAPFDDETVWRTLRRFQILVFDFTAKGSSAEDLARERSIRVLAPGDENKASDLWRSLVELSIRLAASGGDRTREQLTTDLANSLHFGPLRRHHESLLRLEEFSRQALDNIDAHVAGVRLSRQAYIKQMSESLDLGRYVEIRGNAGVGKSGILRYFAEQLATQGRVIVLSPNWTFVGGWPAMRQALDFNGSCRELLLELATNGGAAIFIDNLDFFHDDERPIVITLLREAVSIPGLAVVTTARRTFGTEQRNWLPESALHQLGRSPTISISELADSDIEELRSAGPQLVQLLRDNHPARDVVRNLFRLSRLAERSPSQTTPRTEAEMATEWWRQAGSEEASGRRDRARLLKALAEHSLNSPEAFDSANTPAVAVDTLVKNETLLELKTDRIIFRHDVFREWALACFLLDEPNEIDHLTLTEPAAPDLGRAVELLARMKVENAETTDAWLEFLVKMSAPGVHGSWRRFTLLALVRSELSSSALDLVAPLLIYDGGQLLSELIRLTMAVHVEPARTRFLAAGLDESLIPASMNIPSGPSWLRLIAWLVYRLKDHLPDKAIPDVVKLYSGWLFSFIGSDGISPSLVAQLYRWLREIEIAREKHPYWDDPGVFSGHVKGDELRSLEESLRFNFIAFAYRAPELAADYLRTLDMRAYSDSIRIGILQFRGSLAQAAPTELVDFTLSTLIPKPTETEKRRHASLLREGPFGFNDAKFLPCSPAQGPFFELLTHSPKEGLRLIRQLVDYAIAFETKGAEPQENKIVVDLPEGPRAFPWIDTYLWSREAYGGPYVVTSGLMALEAWAHQRLDKGEAFEVVLKDIIGDLGGPAAYLLLAVDLILSHWPNSQIAAVPFVGSPVLLTIDRRRFARDNGPAFPKLPIMVELDELQKEPIGLVKADDLKKRPSRRLYLDQVLGNYALIDEDSNTRLTLRALLEEAAKNLARFTDDQTFADPEFMVVHALNAIEPKNWHMEEVATTEGQLVHIPVFEPPASEAAHLQRMQQELEKRHPRDMRAEIQAAWRDSSRATDEFLKEALEFVQNAPANDASAENDSLFRMPIHEENAITVAVLMTRFGSPHLKKEQNDWIRTTLAISFGDQERQTHRYRPEYQFNAQAISFLGYVLLLKEEMNAENIRLLLSAASFSNPSASVGFADAAIELAALDERLIRSILRCAFTSRIVPGREWQMASPEQRQQQKLECATDLAVRLDEEIAWLVENHNEPAWPIFPAKRPYLRHSYIGRNVAAVIEDEAEPEPLLDFEEYGAAQWLQAAERLFDVEKRPWLRDLTESYRSWTVVANGAGIPKNEQIDGEPDSWNEQYFKLAADCMPGLPDQQATEFLTSLFDQLPDESLFKNLKTFVGEIDELFFNRNLIAPDRAVLIRGLFASLVKITRGWKRLQQDRTLSSETKISDAVAKLFFNTSGGFLPSKCYLLPVAIPRVTPFLPILQDLALDCRCPLTGLLALNLVEVAPSGSQLSFLIALGSAWLETYQESVQFWDEYQFGKRLCASIYVILGQQNPQPTQADLVALDLLLAQLVRLGIPEAHRAEEAVRHQKDRS